MHGYTIAIRLTDILKNIEKDENVRVEAKGISEAVSLVDAWAHKNYPGWYMTITHCGRSGYGTGNRGNRIAAMHGAAIQVRPAHEIVHISHTGMTRILKGEKLEEVLQWVADNHHCAIPCQRQEAEDLEDAVQEDRFDAVVEKVYSIMNMSWIDTESFVHAYLEAE